MKLLFDTHAFIWWDSAPAKLSPSVLALCQEPANSLLLSVATVWEMQIKSKLGKLKLDMPLAKLLSEQQIANRLEILQITLPHVLELDNLPLHHHDPFDRLLIAQAQQEDAVLLSKDSAFAKYDIQVIW